MIGKLFYTTLLALMTPTSPRLRFYELSPPSSKNSASLKPLHELFSFLCHERYRNNCKLHGIIYVHRISDIRVGGLEKSNFGIFRKLCGDSSLKNVVIVTNMWSRVLSKEEGNRKVRELETVDDFFKPALAKGAQLMHHTEETVESVHKIIRSILKNHPVPLDLQREIVDEGKAINKTGAGLEVDKKITDLVAKYEQKLKEQIEAAKQAQKERDEETRQELLEEAQKAQNAIARLEAERKNQAAEYQRFKTQLAEMEGKQKQEAEKNTQRLVARSIASGRRHTIFSNKVNCYQGTDPTKSDYREYPTTSISDFGC